MDFKWTDRQNQLRDQYSEFAKKHVYPDAPEHSKKNAFDFNSWEALLLTDFWKLIIPEVYGGHSVNWWDFTAALEGIASHAGDSGFVLTLISQAGFIRGLHLFGTEEQKQRIFPELLKGALTSTAIAERHTGTATGSVKTTAVSNGKGAYSLSGDKFNIAHANTAKYTLVVGRIPELGKRDITLFIVENGKSGFKAGSPQDKMGNRSLPTSWIELDQIDVTEKDILGEKGNGVKALVSIVSLDRLYYGLVTAFILKPVFDQVWEFVAERASFGQKVIDHQYVQKKITDVVIHCEQTKWLSYAALWQLLHQQPEALLTCSVSKLSGAKGLEESCRNLMTLLGSRGYLNGSASQLMKDALGFLWVGGTEEMHRINIFKQMERMRKKKE